MISEKDKNIILAYAKKYKSEKVTYPPPSNPRRPGTHATELEQKMNGVEKIRQTADRELEAISLPGAILREVFDFEEEEVS